MRVWSVFFKSPDSPVDRVFREIKVVANSVDEALKKAKKWKEKYCTDITLEISGVELFCEINVS